MAIIYIGIGSNLGDKEGNCRTAIERLCAQGITVKKISSPYRTKPWGVEDQPDFVNMAVEAETSMQPTDLLAVLKTIEQGMGRQDGVRWGPRLIDLDLLFYGDIVIWSDKLTVPHPLLHKRDFVLLPLAEIAAGLVHPVLKTTIRELAEKLIKGEIQ
ncbi:MAG: 2-amino-4-hydroxy-6-hydroxymethyldihydropteridine diphosphokinase [Dissulfurispiraceae bacterium]|jgi:2-amino-4-hydroxy-6-hydroxymethyldihydropteridine diphosphokinase